MFVTHLQQSDQLSSNTSSPTLFYISLHFFYIQLCQQSPVHLFYSWKLLKHWKMFCQLIFFHMKRATLLEYSNKCIFSKPLCILWCQCPTCIHYFMRKSIIFSEDFKESLPKQHQMINSKSLSSIHWNVIEVRARHPLLSATCIKFNFATCFFSMTSILYHKYQVLPHGTFGKCCHSWYTAANISNANGLLTDVSSRRLNHYRQICDLW